MSVSFERRCPRTVENILTLHAHTNSNARRINNKFIQAYRDNFIENDGTSLKVSQKINLQRNNSPQQSTVVNQDQQSAKLDGFMQSNDILAAGDFNVYQGRTAINDFFAAQTTPKRISQVCLLNDDYMLVKHTGWLGVPLRYGIKMNKESTEQCGEIGHESQQLGLYTKAAKYFCCNRNFRVQPVKEIVNAHCEMANTSQAVNGINDSLTAATEVYRTVTKISGQPRSAFNPEKRADNFCQAQNLLCTPTDSTIKQKIPIENKSPDVKPTVASIAIQTHPEPEQLSINSNVRSIVGENRFYKNISQRKYGVLVTPEQRIHNGDLKKIFGKTHFPYGNDDIYKLPNINQSCHSRFAAIRWLTRPFRARVQTKSKGKTPAIIYKAYFVSWKKLSPSDIGYLNGFGVRRETAAEQRPKLRRWRSAYF